MRMMLSEIAEVLNGTLIGEDALITSVGVDSRKVTDGLLFFAIKAARNGHAFAEEAIRRGALAAVVEQDGIREYGTPSIAILVDDTSVALLRLASWWRNQMNVKMIAVVGSNGKTTTKEMIASILSSAMPDAYYATPGNFNNEIGVPLSLFGLKKSHRIAVIEIGMNRHDEVNRLAEIVRPHIAVMTNAQREHMAFFDSLADIAKANGKVFDWMKSDGIAILNADDAFCDFWRNQNRTRKTITVGLDSPADFKANYEEKADGIQIECLTPEGNRTLFSPVFGKHNVRNALSAVAASWAADINLDHIRDGLSQFTSVAGRLQFKLSPEGATIIDDTYNANPDSVEAAINVLASRNGQRIFIMGDMGEVGQKGPAFHAEIGQVAATKKIDRLLTIGKLSLKTSKCFDGQKQHFENKQALIDFVKLCLTDKTTVLVKGSRFMQMEEIVLALVEK